MTVEKLIKEYNLTKDKSEFLSKRIINKYVNYEDKIAEATMIKDATCYKVINNKKVFLQDTPTRFMLMIFTLIKRYTDIEIGSDGTEMLKVFNLLEQNNLVNALISVLPEREYETFQTILNMVIDDEMMNYRDLVPYLDTKIEAFQMMNDAMAEVIEQVGKNENELN